MIDNKNKFADIDLSKKLDQKEKYYESFSPAHVKVRDKQVTFLLDPDVHYEMTQVIAYKRRFEGENLTQAKFITDLLVKNLKRTYPIAKKAFDSDHKK